VIAAISRAALLAPVNGSSQYIPWVILGVLIFTAILVWVLLLRRGIDHAQLIDAYGRLDRLARQDGLTGAHTRRSTGERLAEAHTRARRDRSWLSVVLADVDHFKRINDTFGHLAGDDALIAVAGRMQAGLRADDVLGRWGGEEFLIVLPGTDAATAMMVAERLRQSVVAEPIVLGTGGDAISVSISAGVASSIDAIPEVLVHAADRAMYAAKAEGRDRVRSLAPPTS
jgi:diguanylate cyclase (GGDEF)-like protein